MKKILDSIISLGKTAFGKEEMKDPVKDETKNSLKDEAVKKAYLMTNDVKGEYKTIPLSEVKEILDRKEGILLDVRNPDELESDGYIKDSINIPLGELENRMEELDRDQIYITFCAVGGRSAKAAAMLSNSGFSKIYNAKEGMKTWPYEKIR